MPIYGYQCSACGHQKDALQKLSDPVLTTCPQCQEETFSRQVSAPAFQLKGSGWYVTDFRDGNKAGDGAKSGESDNQSSSSKGDGETKSSSSDTKASGDGATKSTSSSESSPSKSSDASPPAPAPAPASGNSSS